MSNLISFASLSSVSIIYSIRCEYPVTSRCSQPKWQPKIMARFARKRLNERKLTWFSCSRGRARVSVCVWTWTCGKHRIETITYNICIWFEIAILCKAECIAQCDARLVYEGRYTGHWSFPRAKEFPNQSRIEKRREKQREMNAYRFIPHSRRPEKSFNLHFAALFASTDSAAWQFHSFWNYFFAHSVHFFRVLFVPLLRMA